MAELEYLSVFLLYTDMHVHCTLRDMSDCGNSETATPGPETAFRFASAARRPNSAH